MFQQLLPKMPNVQRMRLRKP